MNFKTPSLELETPAGWQDRSTTVLLAPPIDGFRASVVVTIEPGVLDPYLKRHVDLQLPALQEKLPGFVLRQRVEAPTASNRQAIALDYEWRSADVGASLHQHQRYLLIGQTLYTVTATALAARWPEQRETILAVVASLRPRTWGDEASGA